MEDLDSWNVDSDDDSAFGVGGRVVGVDWGL